MVTGYLMSGDTEQNSVGFVRVVPVGLIPPGLVNTIRGGSEGVVRESGAIELQNVDGIHLKLKEPLRIEPGTDIYVTRMRKAEWCKPLEEHERERKQKKAKRRFKEWKRDREKDKAIKKRKSSGISMRFPLSMTSLSRGTAPGFSEAVQVTGEQARLSNISMFSKASRKAV